MRNLPTPATPAPVDLAEIKTLLLDVLAKLNGDDTPRPASGEGNPNDKLCASEAATVAGVRPQTLARWRSDRIKGPPWLKVGRKVVYVRRDLMAWMAENRHTVSS